MKKKVRYLCAFAECLVSEPLGPTDGCIWERQDLNAIPHLVRPRSLTRSESLDIIAEYAPQLEQPRLAHLTPRRDHRRRAEPGRRR